MPTLIYSILLKYLQSGRHHSQLDGLLRGIQNGYMHGYLGTLSNSDK